MTDTVSFPDALATESVTASDGVMLAPLIAVAGPLAYYSTDALGFGNLAARQSATKSLTAFNIGQLPLTLTSAAISQSSAFTIGPVTCTNGATTLPTTLPTGGACIFPISFLAPSGPAPSGSITFTDNSVLSNVPSALAAGSYTQTIALNGSGSSTPPPPPPPAEVTIPTILETVTVSDKVSFQDALDAENVTTSDAVTVAPLIALAGPVAYYSTGALRFGNVGAGQTATQFLTVFNIGELSLTLSSVVISQSSAFTMGPITCTNGATSLPATLPTGGACIFPISFLAPLSTPASGSITLTDNSVLSNVASTPAGGSYTQTIALNGSGSSTPPPPPPPAMVTIPTVLENITVNDTLSFQDAVGVETVKVTDAVTVQVQAAPSITSVNSATFTVGVLGSFTVTASGSPAPVLNEAGALPSGVTFDPSTGVLSGTPTTSGVYSLTFTASDGIGSPATQSFTLTVDQVPAITSGNSATFTVSAPGSFTVTATGFPKPVLSETGALPSGVSFNASTGVLSGTAASATAGTYNITFGASNGVGTAATQSFTLTVNNTPTGTNISVQPTDTTTGTSPVTLSFGSVTQGGITSLTTSSTGPAAPTGFALGSPAEYFNLATTAVFSGTISVCINYTGITFTGSPQLFHYIGSAWVNVTISVDTINHIVCGTVTSLSPFALFAPLPPLTITPNTASRLYGSADPSFSVSYRGFLNGDGPSSLSGALSCASNATPSSPVGSYAITCSGLTSQKYLITFAPGILTVTPALLTVTTANAQRVYGAPNPTFSGTVAGIQNGDNITATYNTAATPTSPVGTYAIVPTLSDPGNKVGNYTITLNNGKLAVNQASTRTALSAAPKPSNFGQSVTLTAAVAPVAPGTGTPTGKVTFSDGGATLGTSTLSSADVATFTTSSLVAGNHNLMATYGGDSNFQGSSSSILAQQVVCGVLISLSSSTVPLGGKITVTGKVISCATTAQTVTIQFTLSGPSQPNSCSSTKSVMFTTPPFTLAPNTSQTVSFPFQVPSGACPGVYTITAATLVKGVPVNTSTASLTVTAH